jgi:hypothetical protein
MIDVAKLVHGIRFKCGDVAIEGRGSVSVEEETSCRSLKKSKSGLLFQ